jgi:hypothetical protein
MSRAMTSFAPPAAVGKMISTGFSGRHALCAHALKVIRKKTRPANHLAGDAGFNLCTRQLTFDFLL